MKTIKIFVASSEELISERREISDMIAHLNYTLNKLDINILLVKWEFLDASMGPKHKQEEYNEELKECEICIVLYWTRFGLYTKVELDTAYEQLKSKGNPRKLYVYFKESDREVTPELQAFRNSFPSVYGHFFCIFRNEDALKSHFLLQFIDYQNTLLKNSGLIELHDSKVFLDGRPFINLNNVAFVGNNEEYNNLLKQIKTTRKLLSVSEISNSEYSEYAQELQNLLKRQQEIEESLWQTALTITRLRNTAGSERLQHAIELFEKGDNRGASAILDEAAIEKDITRNLNLIDLSKDSLKNNIAELQLKTDILKNEHTEGWSDKAYKLNERIITLTEIVHGTLSAELADAHSYAGELCDYCGKFQQALDCYKQALKIRLQLFGKKHVDTASSYNNIAVVYTKLGKFEEALEFLNKALEIRRKISGELHPDTAGCYSNIAVIYGEIGELEKALTFHNRALEIRRKISGELHPDTAGCYSNIAVIYDEMGKFEKALELYNKALEIRREIFGERHLDTAININNIAVTYYNLGKLEESLEFLNKALDIQREIFGEKHPETAGSYNNIAIIYKKQGKLKKALTLHNKALEIRRGIFGERHPETAASYNNIAETHRKLGNIEETLKFYRKTLEIYREFFKENHYRIKTIKKNIRLIKLKRKFGKKSILTNNINKRFRMFLTKLWKIVVNFR